MAAPSRRIEIADGESLYYEYEAPGAAGKTFVFVNALTGNYQMWQAVIAPKLRAAGYGTLVYNFRGQAESRTAPSTRRPTISSQCRSRTPRPRNASRAP